MSRASRSTWLLFVALAGMWGSSYLFIKIGVETITPLTLVAGRLFFGLVLLLAAVGIARERLPREARIYRHLIVMAVLNIVIPFFLITWAEQTTDSALAAILNATVPLFTIVFAASFLHDEPITLNRAVGLAVGFVGVVVIMSRNLVLDDGNIAGEIALIGSSISYGIGNVYNRRNVRGLRPMIPALFQVGFAFAIVTVLAFVFERPLETPITRDGLFAIIWLGILGSGFAYLAYFRILGEWGATRTSMVAYLLPIVGITLGVVVLDESVDVRVLAGTALVIGGVALVNSRFGGRHLIGRSTPAP
ncbi:MAG: DMT family transporter [Chloroflexota bacterium]